MSEKNYNYYQPGSGRDYRIVILLVAGLLLGCNAWLHAVGQAVNDSDDRQSLIRAESLLSRDTITAEMRPIFFLPLQLNNADSQLLETIPGVGPRLAERIIALRSVRKGFHDIAELLDVEGIGPQKFAAIKKFCSL
jgi:hypothetical protein